MKTYRTDQVQDLAAELANNHAKWRDFGWHDRPADSSQWTIIYTENRDSGCLAQSNASVIDAELESYVDTGDVQSEHHGHWACGWVDGWAIRVYKPGTKEVTDAFSAYAQLHLAIEDYPILDEEDLSRRELEACCEYWESLGLKWRLRDYAELLNSPFEARHPYHKLNERLQQRIRDSVCN